MGLPTWCYLGFLSITWDCLGLLLSCIPDYISGIPSEKLFDVDVESMSNRPEFVTKIDEISIIDVDSTSNRLFISHWDVVVNTL